MCEYKKYIQSNHSANFLAECVKHNLTPNTFKIQNPLQEVSIEHTNEINEIFQSTSILMIKSTIKYLKKKIKLTCNKKNQALDSLFKNIEAKERKLLLTPKIHQISRFMSYIYNQLSWLSAARCCIKTRK